MSSALAPAELLALFGHFLMLSLLAVGGALSTAPEMQRWIVGEQGWLSEQGFASSVALAQAAPGPNVLFVAVVGYNVAGLAGVAVAMLGTLAPSSLVAISAQRWGRRHEGHLAVRAFNAGLAPLTLGLLLVTGWFVIEPMVGRIGVAPLRAAMAAGVVAATVLLSLRTRLPPLLPIAIGALLGATGVLGGA
jgi:chromate transporter